ncbi:clasp N terminal-domain-containing protein [Epithele typhae]|uniref:clasp N terminal-domain-containing protein n=1 Tax=Epithele typhae TaxID=378194 RepID=UPI002008298D|nr:clasp N terminal-domain-containing protein [Epithele typhae]KAH9943078.1 clasp N terminal-domain-containing protein [Epithele typhae]
MVRPSRASVSQHIDVKVDAITKLQAEFEKGSEIPDPDALVQTFKACLRTPNQHLTTATLAALPALIPLLVRRHPAQIPLPPSNTSPAVSTASSGAGGGGGGAVDAHALRNVVAQLMPAGGGVVDRLGDARERPRECARATLVAIGGFAFRAGGGGGGGGSSGLGRSRSDKHETPLQMFERFLKEGGLGSKVARVREQSMLTLVHIRRGHHQFPLRPYLPQLVDALEDTDAKVRECARSSVVELFTGPGVTDAARADLKKEMAKKGVRKAITDDVLAKVLAGASFPGTPASEGSDGGDASPQEYVPPSIALMNQTKRPATSRVASQSTAREIPRPVSRAAAVVSPTGEGPGAGASVSEVKAVYIASSRDLETEFAAMLRHFEGRESEHNWAAREQAIQRVRGMLKGEAHERFHDTFILGLKNGFMDASLKTLVSLRTTVASNTCALYNELSIALGTALDPFCELMYLNLLKMSTLTKKITAQMSQATVTTIIQHSSTHPKLLISMLWNALQDKAIQARQYAIGHVKTYLEIHGARTLHTIESSGVIETLEKILKKALGDTSPSVRDTARQVYWIFQGMYPERGTACPNPDALTALPTVTPPPRTKKSSVAAAIAASRAKAKAIANAPPTLRHQATSTSHTIRATSPPSRYGLTGLGISSGGGRPISPSLSTGSSTGDRHVMSAGAVTSLHVVPGSRSPPRNSDSPPSPTSDQSFRRRYTSPLTTLSPSPPTSNSTFRKATETTLPASPPASVSHFVSPNPRPQKLGVNPIPLHRESMSIAQMSESLLLATNIPVPEDSDSDMDMDMDNDASMNLISFSTPYEKYPPAPRSNSQQNSFSPASTTSRPQIFSNALSTGTSSPPAGVGQPLVEDAMRARAEQAESAAERLLELTPVNKSRSAAIMQQAALFQDSPAFGSKTANLFAMVDGRDSAGPWAPENGSALDSDRESAVRALVAALEDDSADVAALKTLARLCAHNSLREPLSPSSPAFSVPLTPSFIDGSGNQLSRSEFWEKDKLFDRLFNALVKFLNPKRGAEELEYGLIVLWEMLENQAPLLEEREAEIFSVLLHIRYCAQLNVMQATNFFRDTLTNRIDPVFGLTTFHSSLRQFKDEAPPGGATTEIRDSTFAFGLIALGKFFLRLPAEVLEEELPRLRSTLISSLTESTGTNALAVREAATAATIAAQMVLRDETHLFTLLDGLPDEKKNLLTYMFDKHGARGPAAASSSNGSAVERLNREMRRIDGRLSSPRR